MVLPMTESKSAPDPAQPLDVLMIEDNQADAELCSRELRKAGFEPRVERVQTAQAFCARIAERPYHVILADYSLPSWNGMEALELLKQMGKDIPFILITGTLRPEEARKYLPKGVADFVHKDSLSHIAPAVRLALERQAARDSGQRPPVEDAPISLAAFPELNPNPVLGFSGDATLGYFNDAAAQMARSTGHNHPADMLPVEVSSLVRTCLASGQKVTGIETSAGGRTFSWSFFPIRQSQVVHCYVTDVTERQKLEAQLRHAQKLESVGRLAAGVAHDFNNVLTVIQGHGGLLRSDPSLSQSARDSVQQIVRAAERAGKLTSQLLAFSRRSVMAPRVLDLNEIITSLSSLLARTLGEDISYDYQYGTDLPPISADRGMVEQVLLNIAVNARDAMPRGGQIVITTRVTEVEPAYVERHAAEARPGRFVTLSITDSGLGMDNVTLGRIFEPFFTTKEFGKGTGLGLATVYGIVKQHRGWIEVQSQLGQGSTFKIYLPPASAPVTAGNERPAEDTVPRGTETILLVEDEPAVRAIIKGSLEKYGYEVLEAGHGLEALALWHHQHERVALLLTDMVMPVGVSGQELAEKLTAQKPALKVIHISGYSLQVAGPGFAIMEGVNFLQKPFDGARLAFAVRHSLDS